MKMSAFRFFLTFALLLSSGWLAAHWETAEGDWKKVENWAVAHPENESLPPFEKIYVGPNDLMTTPQGCYYINAWGEKERVCAVLNDCHGCYVIRIVRQCPVCGRYCDQNRAAEGYDCPFGKVEVLPHIWADP